MHTMRLSEAICYNTNMKLNAKELRTIEESSLKEKLETLQRNPLYFILENIYDTYNVGGIFRLADALGVTKMYLCGQTEIPPNSKIKKASIGTYKVVPWEYCTSALEAIEKLKSTAQIIAVEQDNRSIPYTTVPYKFPVALVVGNETSGVTKETLDKADYIAEIPMWGINRSLNVIVSASIVSYHVIGALKQ